KQRRGTDRGPGGHAGEKLDGPAGGECRRRHQPISFRSLKRPTRSTGSRAMPNIPITLTCAHYARVQPLVTRDVKPQGIDLPVIHGRGGPPADRPREPAPPRAGPAGPRGAAAG